MRTRQIGKHTVTITKIAPVKITFANDEDDALADLIHAVQRIADALAKLAGLDLTPLEPEWSRHDPDSAATRTDKAGAPDYKYY